MAYIEIRYSRKAFDSMLEKVKSSFCYSAEEKNYLARMLMQMLGDAPVLLYAVLIPFRGSIISDGLVMPYRICFGKGAREDFKDAYMNAKRNNAIRFSI